MIYLSIADPEKILSTGYDAMLHSSLSDRLTISREEFIKQNMDKDILGVWEDDCKGMVYFDNHLIHMAVLPDVRGKIAHLFPKILGYGLERYGYLRAVVHEENLPVINLVEELGFLKTGEIREFLIYKAGIC